MKNEEDGQMIEAVWVFLVKPDAVERFESAYGPAGAWSRLFERYPGYRGTTLARDAANPRRFLTVDRWDSDEQRASMLKDARVEYARLDALFAECTESEEEIGVFLSPPLDGGKGEGVGVA
jgi:antibiotic biosynthesis monooxygenase (ABM) superfamily enzyme